MERISPGMTPPNTGLTYVARAYAPAAAPARPTPPVPAPSTLARIGPDTFQPTAPTRTAASAKTAALVAARVPVGIDFSAPEASPQSGSQTIPLYRHPADRNTVATAVHAGRILDVNG